MMKKLISAASVLMFGALAVFAGQSAKAGDEKIFPGTFCRQTGSTTDVSYDGNARVHNPSASTRQVICPIVRDVVLSAWTSVTAIVADRHYTENVVCRAWSAQTDGLGWFTTQSTSGSDSAWWASQSLTFPTQADVRDRGSYYLDCDLPPSYQGYLSGVLSYRIDE